MKTVQVLYGYEVYLYTRGHGGMWIVNFKFKLTIKAMRITKHS
jgi:hypothetical protein